jgi:hypothetical protein
MAISEEIRMADGVSGPAKAAGSALDTLASKFSRLTSFASGVTALGNALKTLGPAGQMAGSIVATIGQVGEAATKAAGKILGAFGKMFTGGGDK